MTTKIDTFIKYIRYELNMSAHTVSAYNSDLLQFVKFVSGKDVESLELNGITINDVRAWIVELVDSGMSQRSVKRKLQAVRALYKWALRNGLAKRNPTQDIELSKGAKKLPSYVRPEVMDSVLDSCEEDCDFAEMRKMLILEMLYETGIRREELITLADKNVQSDRGEIKVYGKRRKERIIPIGHRLCDMINRYRTLRDAAIGRCDYFFVRDNGEPLYPTYVYRVVTGALSVTGLDKRSPHVLRHSFASAMLNNGAEINSVKELLGHTSLSATQVYTHITISELKQNYQQAHPRATKKGG